ncbi:MAG: hypothetical protein KDC38_10200 [Planctomycetes bacterium]|nr:hypothetical protein [Planctomycetota bacterium]
MATCDRCERQATAEFGLVELFETFREIPAPTTNEVFTRSVMSRVRREPTPLARGRRHLRRRAVAVGVTAVLGLALVMGLRSDGRLEEAKWTSAAGSRFDPRVDGVQDQIEWPADTMMLPVDPPLAAGFIRVDKGGDSQFSM